MSCINDTSSSLIFISDLPSYGLIGFVSIGIILYFAYIITFIRNYSSSSTTTSVYIYFSQISLFFLLLSPLTFLFRSSSISINFICSIQNLSLQILPFCLLLGFNIHFIYEWLLKLINTTKKTYLILISTFLIFFLAILIQTAILLIWFYHNNTKTTDSTITINTLCSNECHRPLYLCSLIFNFIQLFIYSFQSSIKYHLNNQEKNFIYLLTSLFALLITLIWICLYLFLPFKYSYIYYINKNTILAYGTLAFAYAFIGPFLYEQIFYYKQKKLIPIENKINRMTFKCLSLTKEQQRAFMAAYIKRNLTVSCENLTRKTHPSNQTCHSTLSVDSLCPTLISTISYESPRSPIFINEKSNSTTMNSEHLILSNSLDTN